MQQTIYSVQVEEILKHKWIESEKAGHDVGEKWAAADWVRKYAKQFREYWNKHKKGGIH